MIITLSGNNHLELRASLDKIIKDFAQKYGELAIERLDGEEDSKDSILEAVQSLPFLVEKKLLIARSVSANKEIADDIEQIISSILTDIDVVFYEPNIDKRTAIYKTLKTQTDFREQNELDARDLPKWAVQTATQRGGEIELNDARYLVDRLGPNQQLLSNELDKLITYESKISRQSIDLLSEKMPQSKVFDLMDAAFSGNKTRALDLYEEQRAQKVEPQEILAMIAWQLRLITLAKFGQGKSSEQIAKDIGSSPYPVQKSQSLASKTDNSKLEAMISEAQKIDKLAKTSPIDLDEALKTYIVGTL